MKVRIRQEGEKHLAYFLDSRRIVEVNTTGARILHGILNQGRSASEIASEIADENGESVDQVKDDTLAFLDQVQHEVHPDGFNLVEQEQLSVPLGVELELTNDCNLRCRHCFQTHKDPVFMPIERALEIVTTMSEAGVCEVSLIGGEPFRYPDLPALLKRCADLGLAVNLVTNATLISESTILEVLKPIPRLVVIVSLDGVLETHEFIRGKGTFEKLDKTLRAFVAHGVAVETTFTINAANIHVCQQAVDYCESLGIPINFNLFKPFKPGHDQLVPEPNRFFDTLVELMHRRTQGSMIGLSNAAVVTEMLGMKPRDECRAARSGVVINMNGRMVPCPSLLAAGFFREEELPVVDENFVESWQTNQVFEAFRSRSMRNCQARSFIHNGNVNGRDPYGVDAFQDYWANRQAS